MTNKEFDNGIERLDSTEKKFFEKIFGKLSMENVGRKFKEMNSKTKMEIAKRVGALGLALLMGAGLVACKQNEPVDFGNETEVTQTVENSDTTKVEEANAAVFNNGEIFTNSEFISKQSIVNSVIISCLFVSIDSNNIF